MGYLHDPEWIGRLALRGLVALILIVIAVALILWLEGGRPDCDGLAGDAYAECLDERLGQRQD